METADLSPLYVYVMCDKRDKDEADFKALDNHLYESGIEPITPFFQGDVTEIREFHEDNLRTCHGVLIYYGKGTEEWIKLKLNDLRKAPGLGRTSPFKAKAVYISSPGTKDKDSFRTREAKILRDGQGFNPELLQSFLEALRA